MESYKLYNFDHPYTAPRKFTIGPFCIEVNETHCENLKKLRRHARYTRTHDDKFRPVVVWKDKERGETVETAIASIKKTDICDSLLYPEVVEYKSIDDLCLLLTFLSGRRVYLEREIDDEHSRHYMDAVVSPLFYQRPGDVWESLGKIKELGLITQFYNIATVSSMNDLLAIAAYSNAILDSLSTKWCKKNKLSSFGQGKLIDELRDEVVNFANQTVDDSVFKFIDNIEKQNVKTRIVDDIVARINYIKGPSAIYRMKEFLIGNDLYPSEEDDNLKIRLRWINKIRNDFVHDGSIPDDANYPWEAMAEITVNITFLILSISQYYFASEVLGIKHDPIVQQEKDEIKKYFVNGAFREKKVFDETYAEYLVRMEAEWTEISAADTDPEWKPVISLLKSKGIL